MSPSKYIGIRDLREMLAPIGVTTNQFKRLGLAGNAPRVALHVGPRMPKWLRTEVTAWLAQLEAQTQTEVTA